MIPILLDTLNLMDSESERQELLRELGWLPADLSCPEKKRLAEEYLAADRAWSNSGKDLKGLWMELRDNLLRRNYTALRSSAARARLADVEPAMEQARLRTARARVALEAHIAEHGC